MSVSSSKLMEAARCTSESMCRSSKYECEGQSDSHGRPMPKNRAIFVVLNNDKEARPSYLKRPTFKKREPKEYLVMPPFTCEFKQCCRRRRVKDQVICLPYLVL